MCYEFCIDINKRQAKRVEAISVYKKPINVYHETPSSPSKLFARFPTQPAKEFLGDYPPTSPKRHAQLPSGSIKQMEKTEGTDEGEREKSEVEAD